MKKLFALLLALTMLFTLGLTSCSTPSGGDGGQDTVVDLEEAINKPNSAVTQATANTYADFFEDETGVQSVAEEALKSGSVTLSVSGKKLLEGSGISKITEVIYANSTDKKYVSDTKIEMEKDAAIKDLAVRLFIDKDGIALQSNNKDEFGIDGTYKFNFATFIDGFKQSSISDMMNLDDAMKEETIKTLKPVKALYDFLFEGMDQYAIEADANAMLKTLIKEETKSENGSIVITITINNQTLRKYYEEAAKCEEAQKLYDKIVELATILNDATSGYDSSMNSIPGYGGSSASMPSFGESLSSTMDMLDAAATFNFTTTIIINEQNSTLSSTNLSGTIKSKASGEEISLSESMTFTDNSITVEVQATSPEGEEIGGEFVIAKASKNGVSTYSLTANVTSGDVTVSPIKVEYSYNKSNGAIALTLEAKDPYNESQAFTLKGTVSSTKDSASIEFTDVTVEDVTLKFNVSIAFKKNVTMPSLPTNAKDVAKMSQEDWEALMESIGNSMLGQMMFAQPAPSPDSGYYPMDSYYGYPEYILIEVFGEDYFDVIWSIEENFDYDEDLVQNYIDQYIEAYYAEMY